MIPSDNHFNKALEKPSSRSQNYLDKALDLARANPIKELPKMAAILTDGRQSFVGLNRLKSHPLQKKFAKHPSGIYVHAEIAAIIKLARHRQCYGYWADTGLYKDIPDMFDGFTMYVARARSSGQAGLAKPCEGCLSAIAAFGIRDVIWTHDHHAH